MTSGLPSEQSTTPRTPAVTHMDSLARQVDVASLAVFRVLFGLLAAGEAYRLVASKHVFNLWMDTLIFFPWPGFTWLSKPAGLGMVTHFYFLTLVGLMLAGGLFSRAAAIALGLGYAFPLLLCETAYLSELYLFALVALLLAAVPAHGTLSADARLRSGVRRESVSRIWLLLLRAQFTIVQFSMGVWMLNLDWLRGSPLQLWLPTRTSLALLGPLHAMPQIIVGLSVLLACIFVFAPLALWWRRTRVIGLMCLTAAWLWFSESFDLGAFPWLMLVGNLLFLPPDWPRRVFNWSRHGALGTGAVATRVPVTVVALASFWLAIQVLVPLRGAFIPGDAAWTEQGVAFSWRVPGPAKAGAVTFSIIDPLTGDTRSFDPKHQISGWQYARLSGDPALLRRYAVGIARNETAAGNPTPEVRALTLVSLNGRRPQRLVDPKIDLAQAKPPGLTGTDWLLPLDVPLSEQWTTNAFWSPPRDTLPDPLSLWGRERARQSEERRAAGSRN